MEVKNRPFGEKQLIFQGLIFSTSHHNGEEQKIRKDRWILVGIFNVSLGPFIFELVNKNNPGCLGLFRMQKKLLGNLEYCPPQKFNIDTQSNHI